MSLLDTASLIVTPNGYKEGKLYSVIPSDGSGDLSVTRATTATRVNSAGLVELVPYNLLQYSEQFDNAYWNKRAGISISADTTTAPNGTLTADTVNYSSGDGYTWFFDTLAPSTSYTISVYAKGSGTLTFQAYWGTGASTGSANTLTSEWQRFSFTFTTGSTTSLGDFGFFVPNTCNIWGAQIVEGSVAKDYQKTETRLNIPRLDYSNGTCPSILVEPQRTNIATYSQDITSWPTGGMTNTANQTTSPDGTQNADKSTIGSVTRYYDIVSQSFTTISGTTYTTSFFAKKGTGIESIYFYENSGVRIAKWNLNDGSYIGHAPSDGYSAFSSYGSESVGNGWYRFWATYTASSSGASLHVGVSTNTNNSVTPITGNGTDFVYIWGFQVEAGSYATSYIPTTSASVTRNADVISKTGISSLIGQTEGTIFAEFIHNGANITTTQSYFTISSGNNNNIITIGTYTNRINPTVRASNVSIFDVFAGPNPLTEGVHKIAIGYKSGDFAIYLDGASILTSAASATFGTMGQLDLGNSLSNNWQLGDGIKATALWKTRLTNDQLATLTTL